MNTKELKLCIRKFAAGKISILMCKSLAYFSAPHFRLGPLTLVALATALPHTPQVLADNALHFIQDNTSKDWKAVSTPIWQKSVTDRRQ